MKTLTHRLAGEPIQIHVADQDSDLDTVREWARGKPALGFDIESTGLDVYAPGFRIRTVQFATWNEAWVIPVENRVRAAHIAATILRSGARLDIHNASFDLSAVAHVWGMDQENLWWRAVDTRILAHLNDNRGRSDGGGHSLEDLTRRHLDPDWKSPIRPGGDSWWARISLSDESYLRYAGMDAVCAHRLADVLMDRIPHRTKTMRMSKEHQAARICTQITGNGWLLDRRYTERTATHFEAIRARADVIAASRGVPDVDDDTAVLGALDHYGAAQIAVNNKTLATVIDTGPLPAVELAKAVRDGRRAVQWRHNHLGPLLGAADQSDRVHTMIRSLGSSTGRMSASRPALHSLPAAAVLRSCLTAEPGSALVSADYKAMELRIAAGLSGDVALQRALRDGRDPFAEIGASTGTDPAKVKRLVYGHLYGASVIGLAASTGVPRDRVATVTGKLAADYPVLEAWREATFWEARAAGHVTTIGHRRLKLPSGAENRAVSWLIQGSGRDLFVDALIDLDRAGYTRHIRLPAHDEVIAAVPDRDADDHLDAIAKHMTVTVGEVELPVTRTYLGRTWGG